MSVLNINQEIWENQKQNKTPVLWANLKNKSTLRVYKEYPVHTCGKRYIEKLGCIFCKKQKTTIKPKKRNDPRLFWDLRDLEKDKKPLKTTNIGNNRIYFEVRTCKCGNKADVTYYPASLLSPPVTYYKNKCKECYKKDRRLAKLKRMV